MNRSPDWGVLGDTSDNPHKDVDDIDSYGPENIYLSKPETGKYWVLVEHWNEAGDATSDGQAQLNVGGDLTLVDIVDLKPHFVRYVATIDWPGGVVTTQTQVMDCNNNWVLGCLNNIP